MKVLDVIKPIDMYGIPLNFTTFKRDQFQTKIGAICTLLTLGSCIVLFLYFGKPVYKKENPNVVSQNNALDYYPQYTINSTTFPFAFRFENEKRVVQDLSKYLYALPQYIQQKRNHITGSVDTISSQVLNITNCTKSLVGRQHIADNLEGWACIDLNSVNVTIGGFYDLGNDYINYFKLTIFFCKTSDGVNYSNCTDFQTINSILNAKVKMYLTLMIPDIAVNPVNITDPVSVSQTNFFFTMNPLLMRTDRYYYGNTFLQQDTGWLFESYSNYTGYYLDRRDTDVQMRTIDDYNDMNKIRTIGTAVFFINNKINQWQVNFQKIQNIIANTGGFISSITLFFGTFTSILCSPLCYWYIVNEIFDFDFKTMRKSRTASKILKKFKFLDTIATKKLSALSNQAILEDIAQTPKTNFDRPPIDINSSKESKKTVTSQNTIKEDLVTKQRFVRKKRRDQSIPLITIARRMLCSFRSRSEVDKMYIHAENSIKDRLDILYYLRLIHKFNTFMGLFLDKEQVNAMNYLKNEVVSQKSLNVRYDDMAISKYDHQLNEEEVLEILRYFKRNEGNNLIDDKLLMLIDDCFAETLSGI
jgi:hypothetical protein